MFIYSKKTLILLVLAEAETCSLFTSLIATLVNATPTVILTN